MSNTDPLKDIVLHTGRMAGKAAAREAWLKAFAEPPFDIPEIPAQPEPELRGWTDEADMIIDRQTAIRTVVAQEIPMTVVTRFIPAMADVLLWDTVHSEKGTYTWHVVMYQYRSESVPEIQVLLQMGTVTPHWEVVKQLVATEYLTMDEVDIEGAEMELFLGILEVVRSNADFSMGMGEQLTRFLDAL